MVLAERVGTKRSFGVGLLLTVVTFGIYAVYWNYKAHNELYRQFELAREGRDEGMVWYVLGLVVPPFLLAYLWVFAANVSYLRERVGLRRGTTPGRLVTLVGLGIGAFAVGIILLETALVVTGTEPTAEEVNAAVDAAGGTFLLLAVLAATIMAVAYRGLQRDINELWDAYDARILYLRAHPEEARPAMAGLAPATVPAALAAPLRREVDALREKHPDLRALAELDSFLARAEAGDAEAREAGEILLADLAALLQERAELARQRDDRVREATAIRERIAAGTIYEEELRAQLAAIEPREIVERLEMLEQALFLPARALP